MQKPSHEEDANDQRPREDYQIYVAYDPNLKLAVKEVPFIHQTPFRFLGKEIYKDLSDLEVRATVSMVSAKFIDLLEKTDRDKVSNIRNLILDLWEPSGEQDYLGIHYLLH